MKEEIWAQRVQGEGRPWIRSSLESLIALLAKG